MGSGRNPPRCLLAVSADSEEETQDPGTAPHGGDEEGIFEVTAGFLLVSGFHELLLHSVLLNGLSAGTS